MSVIITVKSRQLEWCVSFVFIDTMLFQMEWRETITYEICQKQNASDPIASHEFRYFFFNALDWIFYFFFLFSFKKDSYFSSLFCYYFKYCLSFFVCVFIFDDLSIQPMFVCTIKIIFSWLSMMIQSIRWIWLHLFFHVNIWHMPVIEW